MNNFIRRWKAAFSFWRTFPVTGLPDGYWTDADSQAWSKFLTSDTGAKLRHMRWNRIYLCAQQAISEQGDGGGGGRAVTGGITATRTQSGRKRFQVSEQMKRYKTIVVDPPWPYTQSKSGVGFGHGNKGVMQDVEMPYSVMTVDEIASLPVRELSESNSHLYLWTTQKFLRDAYRVLDSWGYKQSAVLVWSKPPMGVIGTYVCSVEFCIFARRGNLEAKRRQIGTCFEWPRSEHSAKPEAFIDMVETVSPPPYLELFARRNRLGWDTWGNECFEHIKLEQVA
jgi:N6-adenosine-specific RNA methylase IME4